MLSTQPEPVPGESVGSIVPTLGTAPGERADGARAGIHPLEGIEGDVARRKLRWWHEVVYVLGFYIVYSAIRNQLGSSGALEVSTARAVDNARMIIDAERALGLFVEESIQRAFLEWDWFIRIWNVFYGSLHFVVTGGVMIFLYHRFPGRYRRYRNVLAFTTGLALVGFAMFPLMPPRLLNAGPPWGVELDQYDFVDTLEVVGGLWSFESATMQSVSNQWAAMPSLHIAWAIWTTLATWPVVRRRWVRAVFVAYPVATLFAIIVTGNHFWLDAAGGLLVLMVGWWLGNRLTNQRLRRHSHAQLQRSVG